jgi:RimJ/RimL family protein N-acetyltransferase
LEIETARLRLRSFSDEDLADLVTLANNWQVARWLSTMPHPYTEADGREWIARVQQDHATGRPRRFAIALKETGRLIGGVGLDGSTGDDSEEPALGYWLGEPYWGNGYAREAVAVVIDYGLRTLGVETIRAYTDPSNGRTASIQSMRDFLLSLRARCRAARRSAQIARNRRTAIRGRCAPLFCLADRSRHASLVEEADGCGRVGHDHRAHCGVPRSD